MLRRADWRVCGALAARLQNKSLLQDALYRRPHHASKPRSFCVPRERTVSTPSTEAFSTYGRLHSPLRSIAQLYLDMLGKRPILTKSITASAIYFFADISSQGISAYQSDDPQNVGWDTGRTLRMVAVGFFMSGPTLHLWFNFVSKVVPKRDLINTLKKMAMGQLIYGPTFTVSIFSVNAFMQGESFEEIASRLKRDFIPTIRSGLMYWPVCDFITYRYVPVHLQPLVSNTFSFVWTVYFTYMACSRKVELAC